jgi:hypothetical protein
VLLDCGLGKVIIFMEQVNQDLAGGIKLKNAFDLLNEL